MAKLSFGAQRSRVMFGGSYGGGAPVPPTTENFASADVSGGFAAAVSTTKNAARIYGIASTTIWCGVIKGTEAKLTATSDWGADAGLIYVSVDGGDYAQAAYSAGQFTLFTGLADTAHFISWRYGSAYDVVPYIASSGNVLEVTGAPPSVTPYANWAQLRDGGIDHWSATTAAATANYLPAYKYDADTNAASVAVRGTFTSLAIAAYTPYVFVSIDGAAPTRYAMPGGADNNSTRAKQITGLSGLHTYTVWTGGRPTNVSSTLSVSGTAALQAIGTARRLDQFGDSITYGDKSTSRGDVDTLRTAAALGFIGSTYGVSGHTIAQTDTLLDTLLPKKVITANDIAVIAAGRNNAGGGAFDAPTIAAYESIISKLQTAGYGTILCRGILPEDAEVWTAENGSISAIVSGLADPTVIFINSSGWSGIEHPVDDGVHPNDAGYITVGGYATTAYATALGL